jgi:uncharacterized caspase-like protein
VPDSNITLLDDEEKTKVDRMRVALRDSVAQAGPDDFLFVFVATQGLHDPGAPEKIYLTGSDSQGSKLGATAIEMSELQQLLNRSLRSRHALFFFDVQHPLSKEWSFAGKPVVNSQLLNLFTPPVAASVLVSGSSSQDSEKSSAQAGHEARSVFASAILEGLSGGADTNNNRALTAKEIAEFVAYRVREATKDRQTPQYRIPEEETAAPVLALK